MATISPNAVLYSAVEMPCASMAGLLPPIAWPMSPGPACEPKISIIPITVPSRPSKGAAGGDGGQGGEVFFQPVRHGAPRALHGCAQLGFAARGVAVEGAQAAGQHFAQGRIL